MNTTEPPKETRASRLLSLLEEISGNRGAIALLRRSASAAQPFRAYPIYGKLGIIHDEPAQIIAMLYAFHPQHDSQAGDIGTSLAKLRRDLDDKGVASFDKRFHRLLSCKTLEEISEIILRLWPLLQREGIAVNYERLYGHLWNWAENSKYPDPEKVKMQWARSYFGAPQETEVPA